MLELRIDVVPHGHEDARHTIGTVKITQIEQLDDDPEGERVYQIVGSTFSNVRHRRSDGALLLCAKALAADTGHELTRPDA